MGGVGARGLARTLSKTKSHKLSKGFDPNDTAAAEIPNPIDDCLSTLKLTFVQNEERVSIRRGGTNFTDKEEQMLRRTIRSRAGGAAESPPQRDN